MAVFENVIKLMGNTPMVKINRMNPNPNVKIYAKLEKYNPGGSVKDRIALYLIEEAERTGVLTKDKTILEATSGNTGIGLALVALVKGYKVALTMSENASMERRKILQTYGAEIILTPGEKGTDGSIEKVEELVKKHPEKYVVLDQFSNIVNPKAHYETTAQEIINDVGKNLKVFVAGIGTSGTITGVGRKLKEYNKKIEVVGVEPQPGHSIPGLKNMDVERIPKIYNTKIIDELINVFDKQAHDLVRELAEKEGLLVGPSSGAAMYGAIKKAKHLTSGAIVVVFPDGGEKYLSTPFFE